MPTSHIVSAKQKIIDLCRSAEFQGRIRSLAANFFQPDEVEAVMVAALNANPKLLECDPNSIAVATLQCVRWRLLPDGVAGMAHLVPYGKKCTLILGYRGLRELALRSPHVKSMFPPRTVYEGDHEAPYAFEYVYGTDEYIRHLPAPVEVRGEITHFYAVATMTSGEKMFVVMAKEDVDVVRGNKGGPWADHYEAMGQKTVVRRLCKALPLSTELQQAVTIDEQGDAGIPQTFTVEPVAPPATGKRTLDDVAGGLPERQAAEAKQIANTDAGTVTPPPGTGKSPPVEPPMVGGQGMPTPPEYTASEAEDGPDAASGMPKVDAGAAKEIIDAFTKLPDDIKDQLRTAYTFKVIGEVRGWASDRADAMRSEIVAATEDGT